MDNSQNCDHRFLYFYFNRNEPEEIQQVVPAHVQYWKTVNPKGFMGGPYADKSGGLISFVATSVEDAVELIRHDPFIVENLLQQKWIKEWLPEMSISIDQPKSVMPT